MMKHKIPNSDWKIKKKMLQILQVNVCRHMQVMVDCLVFCMLSVQLVMKVSMQFTGDVYHLKTIATDQYSIFK